ncbi:peptidyl-tRNA hydrolase [Streptomyces sp. AJS327]|uniref:peptidyl-tRNA hydrolase n=1 Tax=Streptomyces sp. AJS327 TaxID=2545265 RepID=UPI0015DF1A89
MDTTLVPGRLGRVSPAETPGDTPLRRYVLPLVVRVERANPPTRVDALETAARATVTLLADPRAAQSGGEWREVVELWEERGIRKVVRRARGAEWRRVAPLPGLTVTGRTAEVRVFPPVPLDDWPYELSRLQVSGTDLDDPEPPGPPPSGVPVLWTSPELTMSAGKAMAQAAHGAQLLWWALDAGRRTRWAAEGFPLAVRAAHGGEHWARLRESGAPVVRDSGLTEIAPGSETVVAEHEAWHPHRTG